jgi:hypothetical protein
LYCSGAGGVVEKEVCEGKLMGMVREGTNHSMAICTGSNSIANTLYSQLEMNGKIVV